MPRIARVVVVDYPHHITQRGNQKQKVFLHEDDYRHYRKLIAEFAPKYGLEIWAYCLMPNHVHFVAVPRQVDSMAKTFNTTHMLYAQYFNRKYDKTGHLWQGRFFSAVLDEKHLYAAVRYVETNPVRSGLAVSPEEYPWSSASSHIKGESDPLLYPKSPLSSILSWPVFLNLQPDREAEDTIRSATRSGRPCGDSSFLKQMEQLTQRHFSTRKKGRPKVNEREKLSDQGGAR